MWQVLGFAGFAALASLTFAAAEADPVQVLLWHPDQASPPSVADCESLVAHVKPSRDKAEAWLWGRAPQGAELEFYLFLGRSQMRTTFAGEGDYDSGALRQLQARGDETDFELVPDDHPDLVVRGTILAPLSSPLVTVTLRDLPAGSGRLDRVSYYCRFAPADVEI